MRSLLALATLAILSGCAAAPPPPAAPRVLPLRTLRLYETGVGYFERAGTLSAKDGAEELPVPAGHLDDALKTLVVLTPGAKASLGGVEFASSLSHGMARALAGLPTDADAPVTYEALLASLEGSNVEVRTARGPIVGRLIHVEHDDPPAKADDEKRASAAKGEPRLRLAILAPGAQVVRVQGTAIESVRPTDPAEAARLDAALASLVSRGGQGPKRLRIVGDVGAPVTLGYIAEAPVWRTTYRLVLPREGAPTLQGFALLHNDTDEAWRDVRVELVNGRPDSFLFPLAAPRYQKRELVTPENELSTVPQLLGRTADTMWGDHVGESFGAGGVGLSGVGEGGGGRGEGIGLGSIGTIGHGSGTGSEGESSLLAVGDLAKIAKAVGTEAGALFVYAMPSALALDAHASALVPFLAQSVEAEPIAWVEPRESHVARAGVRFVNATPQTLPAGPIAFFADGGFAGESALDRLKPGERRFLTFGADLDVEAKVARIDGITEKVERLTFVGDSLVEHFVRTTRTTWHVENRSGRARAVHVTLDLGRNATIAGADAADFDAARAKPLFVVRVEPRKAVDRLVTTTEGLSRSADAEHRTEKRLAELAATTELPAGERAIASEAVAKQRELEAARAAAAATREAIERAEKDLERYREDAKALGDKAGGAAPIARRLVAAEDALEAARKRLDGEEKEIQKRTEAVRATLARLGRG
jgi:hypothetical protein